MAVKENKTILPSNQICYHFQLLSPVHLQENCNDKNHGFYHVAVHCLVIPVLNVTLHAILMKLKYPVSSLRCDHIQMCIHSQDRSVVHSDFKHYTIVPDAA